MQFLFMVLLFLSALILILLVLVQRGKGGGLAGAFGGMGGQSAFGTKAGDTFTKITIGAAAAWIVLCILSVRLLGTSEGPLNIEGSREGLHPGPAAEQPADTPASGVPTGGTPAEQPEGSGS